MNQAHEPRSSRWKRWRDDPHLPPVPGWALAALLIFVGGVFSSSGGSDRFGYIAGVGVTCAAFLIADLQDRTRR